MYLASLRNHTESLYHLFSHRDFPQTIKVYLSAIRHMHVTAGMCSQFSQQLTPRLQLTLKGIQRSQATSHSSRLRLPITLQLLQKIHAQLSKQPHHYNNILTWAACCLAFFGFLRVSEFTTPSDTQYDEDCHLSINDISLDSRDNPQLVKVTLKQSKTDPSEKVWTFISEKQGQLYAQLEGSFHTSLSVATTGDHFSY